MMVRCKRSNLSTGQTRRRKHKCPTVYSECRATVGEPTISSFWTSAWAVRYSPVPAEDINMKLSYTIKFVADMNRAVKFYRDTLGLPLKFESPGWSEFATGETTLALHPASEKNPAGTVELGFTVPNLENFY